MKRNQVMDKYKICQNFLLKSLLKNGIRWWKNLIKWTFSCNKAKAVLTKLLKSALSYNKCMIKINKL